MNKSLLFTLSIALLLSASLSAVAPLAFCQTEDSDALPVEYRIAVGHECLVKETSGMNSFCRTSSPLIHILPHRERGGRSYPVLKANAVGEATGSCTKVPDDESAGALRRPWRVTVTDIQ